MDEFVELADWPGYLINRDGMVIGVKGEILTPIYVGALNEQYAAVALYKDTKRTTTRIHRLVAETFLPNPDNLPVVDHIDGDKSNNSVSNLRWVTHSANGHNRGANSNSKTGIKGVSKISNRNLYLAKCIVRGVRYHKCFKTITEAQNYLTDLRTSLCVI